MTIQKIEIKQRCYTKSGPEILRTTIQNAGQSATMIYDEKDLVGDYVTLVLTVGAETHHVNVSSRIAQSDGKRHTHVDWVKV